MVRMARWVGLVGTVCALGAAGAAAGSSQQGAASAAAPSAPAPSGWAAGPGACTGAGAKAAQQSLAFAGSQARRTLQHLGSQYTHWPTVTSGHVGSVRAYATQGAGWTMAFWPGQLWLLANATGDAKLAGDAAAWTQGCVSQANNTGTHDVGFMVFGSFGKGLQMWPATPATTRAQYVATVLEAARSLSQRWVAKVGMLRSWGSIGDHSRMEVIIDNLMNLELLFWAARRPEATATERKTWTQMATSHALNTGKWWIRPDGSTYHLVVFNPETGALISRSGTPQGLAANSTWARGQAWAVYGFTMAYRYTRDPAFLAFARNVTRFWTGSLDPSVVPGADWVPKWDFNATAPADPVNKDTSAAGIVASALQELALPGYTGDASYARVATQTIAALTRAPYIADPAQSMALMTHNGHEGGCDLQDGCVDMYTDYYTTEALRRCLGMWAF